MKKSGRRCKTKPAGTASSTFTDYTHDEWRRIDQSIEQAGLRPLSTDDRLYLVRQGKEYQAALSDKNQGVYAPTSKRDAFWRKLKRDFAQLRRTLESAPKLFGTNWHLTPFSWPTDELQNKIFTALLGPEFKVADIAHYVINGPTQYITLGLALELVADCEEAAFFREKDHLHILDSVTRRNDPKVIYCQQVLWVWMRLGGRLTLPTRNWKTGKLGNDLTNFFRAAADPVLLDATPSDESISDIVKRQKLLPKTYRWD